MRLPSLPWGEGRRKQSIRTLALQDSSARGGHSAPGAGPLVQPVYPRHSPHSVSQDNLRGGALEQALLRSLRRDPFHMVQNLQRFLRLAKTINFTCNHFSRPRGFPCSRELPQVEQFSLHYPGPHEFRSHSHSDDGAAQSRAARCHRQTGNQCGVLGLSQP